MTSTVYYISFRSDYQLMNAAKTAAVPLPSSPHNDENYCTKSPFFSRDITNTSSAMIANPECDAAKVFSMPRNFYF